jgi:inositol oxygenase
VRDFDNAPQPVKDFYREHHTKQTLAFVLAQKQKYRVLNRESLGVWDMLEQLDTLRDESDPDTELSQMQHALQSAQKARHHRNLPDWFILTALIHDMGKALCRFGEPQWAVVGDTFPVGCRYSKEIVLHEFLAANPDSAIPEYQTELGIYHTGCGLDRVNFSWGHDEYLYTVVMPFLPPEALAIIRYHSAYPIHHDGAYPYLLNDHDRKMLRWVRAFQKFDLYSKDEERVDPLWVRAYYKALIAKYLPPVLNW